MNRSYEIQAPIVDDELASMTLHGFTEDETLTLSAVLRRDTAPRRLADSDGLALALALFKVRAAEALQDLTTAPPGDVAAVATAQARVAVYLDAQQTVASMIEAGDRIWETMHRDERAALAKAWGVEPEEEGEAEEEGSEKGYTT